MKNSISTWMTSTVLAAAFVATFAISTGAAEAQSARKLSTCLAVAQAPERLNGPTVWKANYQKVQASLPNVTITYATHSTFRIETESGVVIATDYAGNAGNGRVPDVVTMNHAHGTHFTYSPDPAITHVLKGWGDDQGKAEHYLEVQDVLIRNVTSDIYRGGVLIEKDGNSIFVFEVAGLCIGHVGHLHHTLTPEHIAEIGRLDVVMLPVDGGYTMSLKGMTDIARQFRSSIMLPMHWFSSFSLQRFISEAQQSFEVEMRGESSLEVSLNSLPAQPKVIVLQPQFARGYDFGD